MELEDLHYRVLALGLVQIAVLLCEKLPCVKAEESVA